MSTYTQQYTRPYADGYKDRPDESTPEYARYINARDDALLRIEAFLAALQIPEKLSELVNDEGFIKNTVSNLANYYLKSETYARTETYTQAEVQALIADAVSKVSGKLNISVVDALPTSDISTTTFYLVPKETAQEKNLYDEYINTDGRESGWELIGAVSTEMNPSDFYKKPEVDALLDKKVSKSDLVQSKFVGTKAVIGGQVGGADDVNYVFMCFKENVGDIASTSNGTDPVPFTDIETNGLTVENYKVKLVEGRKYFIIASVQNPTSHYINICNKDGIFVMNGSDGNYQATTQSCIYTAQKDDVIYLGVTNGSSGAGSLRRNSTFAVVELSGGSSSANVMHNYSTEEKVIGTWYDGKTLYEKGYLIQNAVILTTEWVNIIQISDPVDNLAGWKIYDPNYVNNMYLIRYKNGYLQGFAAIGTLGINEGSYITIQYTKTTDTATA